MKKELELDTVYSFKLDNRDEVIATVKRLDADNDCIWVDKPVLLMLTPEGPQMPPLMLTTTEHEFPLSWGSILTYAKTKDDAEAAYKRTTTGIEVPNKQIITG